MQIDPINSRTQLHLAWSYAMNGMPNKAGHNFLLACELNSNDPWTLVSASLGLAYCNDLDNAERLSKLALDIGLGVSKLHWSYQAGVRFILEDFAGCIDAANQAEDVVFYIGGWKAAACAITGDLETARHESRKFVSPFARTGLQDSSRMTKTSRGGCCTASRLSAPRSWQICGAG